MVKIVPPSVQKFKPKNDYSKIDNVERAGYVANYEKIDTFINTGMLLMDYHANSSEYDIPESESDFEQDTPEYLEELTKQAEDFDSPPLMQHFDKITAEEVLDNADKVMKMSEKVDSKKTKKSEKSDAMAIKEAIKEGFSEINSTLKNSEPSQHV